MRRRLILASGNRHKVTEIAEMFAASPSPITSGMEVVSMKDLGDPPEIPETADTFHGNAVLKARGIAAWLASETIRAPGDDLVLADDSGICIDAFDGAPGVYSARFAGPNAGDDDNNAKMVAELRARGLERSPAHYTCVLAVTRVDGTALGGVDIEDPLVRRMDPCVCVEGRCHGVVRTVAQGSGGFGYDPYFWVDDDAHTFADLSAEQKAVRSHRGAAVASLLAHADRLFG